MANPSSLIPFKPGDDDRRQKGRITGSKNRSTQLRKWVDLAVDAVKHPTTGDTMPGTVEDQMDVAQIAMAIAGNTNAYNAIKEELYGKRMQRIEHTGEDGAPIQVDDLSKLSSDDIRQRIAALRAGTPPTPTSAE